MGLIALKEEISIHLISLYIQHPQLEGSRILHNIYIMGSGINNNHIQLSILVSSVRPDGDCRSMLPSGGVYLLNSFTAAFLL